MSVYGSILNPHRKVREPRDVKGIHQNVVITHNASTHDQKQQLLLKFPKSKQ